MGHYKSNLRDIEFNLFEVLGRQDVLGSEHFPEIDEQTARGILDEVNRLATGPIADSFAEADRNPPVFDPETSSVRMPEAFRKSFQAFMDAECFRLELPTDLAPTLTPRSLVWPRAGRGPGRQGPVDVPRAQVPGVGRRRAGRAQRRLRDQRRAQDGPEGLHHLRADLR